MNNEQGNLILTVSPPGNRTATPTTTPVIQRGTLTGVFIGIDTGPAIIGKLWVEVTIVRLTTSTGLGFSHLIGSYVTLNHIPSWTGIYELRYGDSIQLMAMSDTANITVYADIRFAESEVVIAK